MALVLKKLDRDATFVLDLGCGEGKYSSLLLKGLPNCRFLIGIDLSLEYIKKAKVNNPSENIEFLVADGQRLPFREKCFDLTISKDLLHHVKFPLRVLEEISRVSKKQLAIIEANRDNPIMLLNEKYGKHQHLTFQQLEFFARYLGCRFSYIEANEYPITLRLLSFKSMALVWNLLMSLFLMASNQVPFVTEILLKTFCLIFAPSFNVLIIDLIIDPETSKLTRARGGMRTHRGAPVISIRR
jgi:SAM-dependent methyltransferase